MVRSPSDLVRWHPWEGPPKVTSFFSYKCLIMTEPEHPSLHFSMHKFSLKWLTAAFNAFLRAAFGNKRLLECFKCIYFNTLPGMSQNYSDRARKASWRDGFPSQQSRFSGARETAPRKALGFCQVGAWVYAKEINTGLQIKQMLTGLFCSWDLCLVVAIAGIIVLDLPFI